MKKIILIDPGEMERAVASHVRHVYGWPAGSIRFSAIDRGQGEDMNNLLCVEAVVEVEVPDAKKEESNA